MNDFKKNNYQGQNTNKSGGQQQRYNNLPQREKPAKFLENTPFENSWILTGADMKMVEFAEKAGKYMAPYYERDKEALSKSQIRNVFGEIRRIEGNFSENKFSFYLLKPKVAYAEGRNRTQGLSLFKLIFDKGWELVNGEEKKFKNFCNLIEAILAYHKANGGKD
ncbi:type III-A CRISPR-associated protein Csm2 [Bacteroides sp.]